MHVRKQRYTYAKINGTQYTLALTVPLANMYQFHGQLEIRRDEKGNDVTNFFEKPNEARRWSLNPDWTYCEYIQRDQDNDNLTFSLKSKEDVMLHFLRKIQNAKNSWKWRNTNVGIKKPIVRGGEQRPREIYSCK